MLAELDKYLEEVTKAFDRNLKKARGASRPKPASNMSFSSKKECVSCRRTAPGAYVASANGLRRAFYCSACIEVKQLTPHKDTPLVRN